MSFAQILRRVGKVEQVLSPRDGPIMVTLEELCRSIWEQDKPAFLELGTFFPIEFFRPKFEREAALATEAEGSLRSNHSQSSLRRGAVGNRVKR